MFQSLWNVAAAFCDHENRNIVSHSSVPHFGHHVALNCQQDQQQHEKNVSNAIEQVETLSHDHSGTSQLNDFLNHLDDDHSDHLPSFAHFIVADVSKQADQPKFVAYSETTFIDWKNLYQSPDLFQPNPPPAFSPL